MISSNFHQGYHTFTKNPQTFQDFQNFHDFKTENESRRPPPSLSSPFKNKRNTKSRQLSVPIRSKENVMAYKKRQQNPYYG